MDYSWEQQEAKQDPATRLQQNLGNLGSYSPPAVDTGALSSGLTTRTGNTGISGGLNLEGGAQPATPTPTGPSALSGVSGVSGLASLSGPQAPPTATANAPTPGAEPLPQPQTAGRLVKPAFGDSQGQAPALDALAQKAQGLAAITDPQQKAVAQDEIARGVASALQGAGHTVKWNGDQLMVDGRPYVIGGATTGQGMSEAAGVPMAPPDALNPAAEAPPMMSEAPATAVIDPNQAANELNAHFRSLGFARDLTPQEFEALKGLLGISGDAPITADTIVRAKQYLDNYTGDINNPWKNGTPPGGGGGGGTGGGGGGGGTTVGTPQWRSGWKGYQPGEVTMDDLQGLDVDSLMRLLGDPVRAGALSTDPATERMVQGLLDNPYTFDQQMVDTLKAKSKDELAEMGAQDQEALRNYGFDQGITDSNWLASERNAARRDTDRAIVSKNRDIDIMKAETDMADRRKAAELGMEFSDRRFSQVLQSQQERRQAVALASDTQLRAAAQRGDRMALREQINAKAAELGLDADKMQLQYTLGMMDDLTKRYGIDVGKDIDLRKLAEQGRQFNEDLVLKFAQLQFQYDELMKRDEWAQLDAGTRLAIAGYSGESAGYDPDLADGRTDPRDRNRNGIPDSEE